MHRVRPVGKRLRKTKNAELRGAQHICLCVKQNHLRRDPCGRDFLTSEKCRCNISRPLRYKELRRRICQLRQCLHPYIRTQSKARKQRMDRTAQAMNLRHRLAELRFFLRLNGRLRHTGGENSVDPRPIGCGQKRTRDDDGHGKRREWNGRYDEVHGAACDLLRREREGGELPYHADALVGTADAACEQTARPKPRRARDEHAHCRAIHTRLRQCRAKVHGDVGNLIGGERCSCLLLHRAHCVTRK